MADSFRITGLTDLDFLENVSSVVTSVDFHFAKSVAFASQLKTIEYEGDGQTAKKYYLTEVEVEIETDTYDMEALADIFAKTAVTAGLPSGVAKRWYWGANADASGIVCGLSAELQAEDVDTGTNCVLRAVIPRGTLSPADAPQGQTSDKSPMKLKFSSLKTTTDIAGAALPSVPADGCHWYLDRMS